MGPINSPEIVGVIEAADERIVVGWAFNKFIDEPITLALVIDGVTASESVSNLQRADVLNGGFGREFVGFRLEVPASYCDGLPHFLQIHTAQGDPLGFIDADGAKQTEWIFSLAPEYVVARLDRWDGRDIHCWAVIVDRITDEARPADYIVVRQSGKSISKLSATTSRPDVADLFNCRSMKGFVVPNKTLRALVEKSALHFYAFPSGQELSGSPLDISGSNHTEILPRDEVVESPLRPEDARPGASSVQAPTAAIDVGRQADWINSLKNSALFDEKYYLLSYPDVINSDLSPADHFLLFGHTEGRRPNFYFEPNWYRDQNPEIAQTGIHPLLHFFLHGDRLGRNPGPLFDVTAYRARYGLSEEENTLAHYLKFRQSRPLSPLPDFDADFYAVNNPDVFDAGVDMFEHFFSYGYKELRNPSASFDIKFYVQRYLSGDFSQNPFVHFWTHRHEDGVFGKLPEDEVTVSREIKRFTRPGPHFEERQIKRLPSTPRAMLLAYYLPQFHAFPENDGWWGTGFTEWTNLVRGSPRFVDHYQPRVPRDLGFYTLDGTEPMRRQIEMAKGAGVSGFVFYYYWFNKKRLMEKPLQRFLDDPTLDINFALMWANENWTRRWDGAESEVLISQDYRTEDELAMIAEYAAHFRDPRYIRLQGRPLLMIYRPGIIPNTSSVIQRWRELFRSEFQEDPIFVMAQAFDAEDPHAFGFDGAIEFPPHKLTRHMIPANQDFKFIDPDFTGAIHRYDDVVAVSLAEEVPTFPIIKTAVPSWDNDSRRQGSGLAITGSNPEKYENWLQQLICFARAHPFFGESIVCINAWNEWCEGAYLEPDLHFGSAYLNATARALDGLTRSSTVPKLILIGHDAFPGGAQHLLLNIGRVLKQKMGLQFEYLLLAGGKMVSEYAKYAPVTVAETDASLVGKLKELSSSGFSAAIVNTSAAGRAVAFAHAQEIQSTFLIHELPRILIEKDLREHAMRGLSEATTTIFSSAFAREAVLHALAVQSSSDVIILPQGSYKKISYNADAAQKAREILGLEQKTQIVLGVGYADLRKGFDLFIQLWRLTVVSDQTFGEKPAVCFVWVGGIDPTLQSWLADEIFRAEATGTFKMAGYYGEMEGIFSASSVFVLTSREDPLPTVVMEAMGAGVPVVAFEGAGGIPDLLRDTGQGRAVPYGDTIAMAQAVKQALSTPITPEQREHCNSIIDSKYDFDEYVRRILKISLPVLAAVTVAIPNYNYAQYMPDRLASIFRQIYPITEIIVLDDCSVDRSIEVILEVAQTADRAIQLIVNETNSGSVFIQWRRAAEEAVGEFVWIAEADDSSDPEFLCAAVNLLAADVNIAFAFTDSQSIDVEDKLIWESYKGYYESVEAGGLRSTAIFDGEVFAERFLSKANVILNVSAVVWRRSALLRALDGCREQLSSFRMAGDWLLYLTALSSPGSKVGYDARPLNVHRRHAQSVTHALAVDKHIAEIDQCHTVARNCFNLSEETVVRQAEYLREVSAQLMGSPPAA